MIPRRQLSPVVPEVIGRNGSAGTPAAATAPGWQWVFDGNLLSIPFQHQTVAPGDLTLKLQKL
jgi:hypothetical protein